MHPVTNTIEETLFPGFIEQLTREGKSPATIKDYTKWLRQFLRVLEIKKVEEIDRCAVEQWMLHIRGISSNVGYLANHLWAIRKFLLFLKESLHISHYEFDIKIPFPQAPEAVEYLEPNDLESLCITLDLKNIHSLRTRTYIELLLNTGLRPSEALSLDRKQVEDATDEVEIVGKGRKHRKIYLNERARRWISRYLKARTDDNPALFVTHCKAQRLSLRHAETTFRQAITAAGIKKRIRLHDLRHTYGTNLLIHGCPIDYVAVLMGHASVDTTRRHYLAVRQKHAKEGHFKYLNYKTY